MVLPPLPLPTLMSQALVAHTIEIDNEAEHQLPHRTTRQKDPDVGRDAPWLVSFALWANVLQYLDVDEAITVADLRSRARTDRLLLGGLRRWGYVSITPPADQSLRNPPQDEARVRARKGARRAMEVWSMLPTVIEERWRTRLGAPAVDRLEQALRATFEKLTIDPPASLPVIHPTQGGKAEQPPRRGNDGDAIARLPRHSALSPLLSGVLLAFTLDVEADARTSLAISANTLRVLTVAGTRIRDLPLLTGVSREANAMAAGWLERRGCAGTEPDTTATRGNVVRLTPKGQKAQESARRIVSAVEDSWRTRFGASAVDDLRAALEHLVGDGTYAGSPLAAGLVPYDDNWRATTRRPETLPHHPMVLHRGGYPDGS